MDLFLSFQAEAGSPIDLKPLCIAVPLAGYTPRQFDLLFPPAYFTAVAPPVRHESCRTSCCDTQMAVCRPAIGVDAERYWHQVPAKLDTSVAPMTDSIFGWPAITPSQPASDVGRAISAASTVPQISGHQTGRLLLPVLHHPRLGIAAGAQPFHPTHMVNSPGSMATLDVPAAVLYS